jgi:hypothetical protein
MRRFPARWTVEALIAIAFLTGCDDANVYTLYRSSPTVGEIHGEKARTMRRRARNIIELTAKQRGGYLPAKESLFDIGARRAGIGLRI